MNFIRDLVGNNNKIQVRDGKIYYFSQETDLSDKPRLKQTKEDQKDPQPLLYGGNYNGN